jgi:hypothetical protein
VAVATVGLNPALNEWQEKGRWRPMERRLSILSDFNATKRGELTDSDLIGVRATRDAYFTNKPHSYFGPLESLLQCVKPTWSYHSGTAIHLDLVACATRERWGYLPTDAKVVIKANCRENVRHTLRLLPGVTILLLNGKPVLDGLLEAAISASVTSRNDDTREIRGASGTRGFLGHISAGSNSLRYLGWSAPISTTSGPTALAIALWIRQMTETVSSRLNTILR